MTQWVFRICFSSVSEIKLQQIFVSKRNLQCTSKLLEKQGILQPCRSNNLKNLFFEPSAVISVKIRNYHVFLAKSSLKNICDPLAIGICLYSVSEIKLMQNFVGKRNLRFVSSFFRNKLGLQAYRINILKTRLWETSGAILG